MDKNVELNPSKAGGVQVERITSKIPDGWIPDTAANTYIMVTGQEVSQTIEQVISGDFMGRLIVQPTDCGEQNMIIMTLPLIATHYLDTTRQWEGVGMHRRNEAIQHIQTGYNRELSFRKADGSYAAFPDRPSSTWLTAYVVKVFAMARDLIVVEDNVLCSALQWLVLKAQMSDGMFKENGPVIHGEMIGDVQGKDADASLTAFVLIAMQEGNNTCAKSVTQLQESIRKAIGYLEQHIFKLTNPYSIAMSSYAMAKAGKFNKDLLIKSSSQDGTYWHTDGGHYFSLEATAYALLSLVKDKDYDAAGKAVGWLNRQSNVYGGYGTTQATITVFQAVAEYYMHVKALQNTNLVVDVAVSGRSSNTRWIFRRDSSHLTRTDKVMLNQEFTVTAKGTGVGSLKIMTVYYAQPAEKENDCKMFNLTVKMEKLRRVSYTGATESYSLNIETIYRDENRDATMSILDIGLLTGFVVDNDDLEDLTKGKVQYIQKFEINNQLSEKGSLILYLDKISHQRAHKIDFKVHKINDVTLLQPAAVSVYEYYSPERCVKFYHPQRTRGIMKRLCNDQEGLCQCAEENCSIQKKINNINRTMAACEAGMDYVYKATVLHKNESHHTDFYYMKIDQVAKEGTDEGVEGEERRFIGHPSCRKSFGFEVCKSYLIMGHSADLLEIGGKLQYILGEKTWIEYWPTRNESETPKYKDSLISITTFAQELSSSGCTT